MNLKFFNNIFSNILFVLATTLTGLIIFASLKGFYYSGDVVSYLDSSMTARRGDLVTAFRWSYNVWTPGMPMIFNLLRILPINFVSQQHVFVFLTLLANIFIAWLIIKNITKSKVFKVILIGLLLFGSIHILLYQVSTSESLFMFVWLLTIYSLERFMTTQKERYILLFILSGSALTMVRYAGIWVLLGFMPTILLYLYQSRHKRNYSLSLILVTVISVWIPIIIYMLRNWILSNTFYGVWDKQFVGVTITSIFNTLLEKMLTDTTVMFISGLFIGTKIVWNERIKHLLYICSFSVIIYFVTLVWTQTNIRMYDAFGSRYLGVSYPTLMLLAITLGSLLHDKFPVFKRVHLIAPIIIAIIFGNQIYSLADRVWRQSKSDNSVIAGVEYSQNIRKFCRKKQKDKYLFIQGTSRNWVGQSLRYYCQPITNISSLNTSPYLLPQGVLLYTPYEFTDPGVIKIETYNGEKKVFIYRTEKEVNLDVQKKIKELNNHLY